MRTTVNPSLMSFLNNDTSESLTNLPLLFELPPLLDQDFLQPSHRPLLLEPIASTRSGESSSQASQNSSAIAPIDDNEINHRDGEEVLKITNVAIGKDTGAVERTLGSSSPQSLRKILDDNTGNARLLLPKKQQRSQNGNDDFVQLPRPPKKQRSNKQVVPPIIIGLHEPPPQAALFPPIASSSFHDSHGRNTLKAWASNSTDTKGDPKPETLTTPVTEEFLDHKKTAKKKRKDVGTRNKWTEGETNNLLLGVYKHGVGKWADILEDPSFTFNRRSAVDLKDRFRTCCPDELRGEGRTPINRSVGSEGNDDGEQLRTEMASLASSSGDLVAGRGQEANGIAPNPTSSQLLHPGQKPRGHRKKLTDLEQLGIRGAFKRSKRRERCPFSEQEDREIAQGYSIYGPAWSRIQRDPQFNLQNRRPIDLRDRFRNKNPEKFRSGEDDVVRTMSQSTSASVDTSSNPTYYTSGDPATFSLNIDTSKVQLPSCLYTPKDNFPLITKQQSVESTDSLSLAESLECTESMNAPPFPGNIGEMDISRLLEHPWSL